MIKIYTAINPTEAHMVKGILESYGIKGEVRGESLFSARGELPITPDTAPTVWILNQAHHLKAINLIKEFEQNKAQQSPRQPSWTCAHCHEESESQFTACWNCGKDRNKMPSSINT